MKHKYEVHDDNCNLLHCDICDVGILYCTVCECCEEALTVTDCPGEPISDNQKAAIYTEGMDYKDGKWT